MAAQEGEKMFNSYFVTFDDRDGDLPTMCVAKRNFIDCSGLPEIQIVNIIIGKRAKMLWKELSTQKAPKRGEKDDTGRA